MRILIRKNDQDEWQVVESAGYNQEADPEKLLRAGLVALEAGGSVVE